MKKKKKSAFTKILEMIAPAGMSAGEYILHCSVNGVNADPLDVAFSEWLIKESFMSDADFYEKVGDLIAESIKDGELLALPEISEEADAMLSELLPDAVMASSNRVKAVLFEAVLDAAPKTSRSWEVAWRLNKAFGFTSAWYFSKDERDMNLVQRRK